MKKWGMAAMGAAAVALAAGCSLGAPAAKPEQLVEITVRAYSFNPNKVLVNKNVPVRVVYNNQDEVEHDWVIDQIIAKNKAAHSTHAHATSGPEPDLHIVADSKKTATMEFIPLESGTYLFYCTVSGHKERGMHGTLIVQ